MASITGTTFTDTGLTTGTSYTYRVTVYDGAGNESAAAGSVTGIARDIQAPSVPQNLRSTNVTANSVTLTWSASTDNGGSGLAGYRVFRNDILVATVSGTGFINTGLAAGAQYRYRVAAIDNAGNQSGLSSRVTVNTRKKLGPDSLWARGAIVGSRVKSKLDARSPSGDNAESASAPHAQAVP